MVELDMTAMKELEAQRRAEHKCIDCGAALEPQEIKGRNVRCAPCRKIYKLEWTCPDCGRKKEDKRMHRCLLCERNRRAKQIKAEREQAEKAMARYAKQVEKCRACYWATAHDGFVFCPSMKGTCLRQEM